jgi:hypothetical protein
MEPLHADLVPSRAKPRVVWLLQQDDADRRAWVGRRQRRRLTRTRRGRYASRS